MSKIIGRVCSFTEAVNILTASIVANHKEPEYHAEIACSMGKRSFTIISKVGSLKDFSPTVSSWSTDAYKVTAECVNSRWVIKANPKAFIFKRKAIYES